MIWFARCLKTAAMADPTVTQAGLHAPHLSDPTSWRLCEANPCSARGPALRKERRARPLRLMTVALAAIYSLGIALRFPAETPLLLLAVLPLPGVVDALLEDAR